MSEHLGFLEKNWSIISEHIWLFAGIASLSATLTFAAVALIYSSRIEGLNEHIDLLRDKHEYEMSQKQIDKLVKETTIKNDVKVVVEDNIPSRSMSEKFLWPVKGRVISTFGIKSDNLRNDGINIQAPLGAPVQAAENGIVVYVRKDMDEFGRIVLIKHSDGWLTVYAHLEKILVKESDVVKIGEPIGTVGKAIMNTEAVPQLHFEIRKGEQAVDPEPFLQEVIK